MSESYKMEETFAIEHPTLKRETLRSSTLKTHPGTGARFLGTCPPACLGWIFPDGVSFLIRLTGIPPRALGWKVFEHCKMEEPSMIEHPILKRKALRSSTFKTHPGTGARFPGTCPPACLGWIFPNGDLSSYA